MSMETKHKILTLDGIVAYKDDASGVWVCFSSMHAKKRPFPDLHNTLNIEVASQRMEFSTKEDFLNHMEKHATQMRRVLAVVNKLVP